MNAFGVINDKNPESPLRTLIGTVLNQTDTERDLYIEEEVEMLIAESQDYRHYMQEYESPISILATFCGDKVDSDPQDFLRAQSFLKEEADKLTRREYDPLRMYRHLVHLNRICLISLAQLVQSTYLCNIIVTPGLKEQSSDTWALGIVSLLEEC